MLEDGAYIHLTIFVPHIVNLVPHRNRQKYWKYNMLKPIQATFLPPQAL